MASTRNRNSEGDYRIWETSQASFGDRQPKVLGDAYSATRTCHAGNGLIQGNVPSIRLANNSTDIESSLRGIRANDWVNGPVRTTPDVKSLPSFNLAERLPTIMPAPMTVTKGQRAMYMN